MSNDILTKIKNDLNDDKMYQIILPKLESCINNPDKRYGIISPMYSLMPYFFYYFNTDTLTQEQMYHADKVIKIVDNAFGGGWDELVIHIQHDSLVNKHSIIKQIIKS